MNNLPFFNIALQFLLVISQSLTTQLQTDLAKNNSVLDDQVLELKREIVGGGTIDLLDANTLRLDGICSFDKNSLAQGRAFVFDRIAINYATNAASSLEGELEYNTKAPKELQNALFVINQAGREVLRMPLRDLHNIQTGQNAADEYTQLKSLRYLVDNRDIEMQIKFPQGVSLSNAVKHYVYVRISGLHTVKKANS